MPISAVGTRTVRTVIGHTPGESGGPEQNTAAETTKQAGTASPSSSSVTARSSMGLPRRASASL